jgi:hypothetical protein
MFGKLTVAAAFVLATCAFGCTQMSGGGAGIMRADPGDPTGSANIGTGSVTTGSTIPPEAKAAGMGLGP